MPIIREIDDECLVEETDDGREIVHLWVERFRDLGGGIRERLGREVLSVDADELGELLDDPYTRLV